MSVDDVFSSAYSAVVKVHCRLVPTNATCSSLANLVLFTLHSCFLVYTLEPIVTSCHDKIEVAKSETRYTKHNLWIAKHGRALVKLGIFNAQEARKFA